MYRVFTSCVKIKVSEKFFATNEIYDKSVQCDTDFSPPYSAPSNIPTTHYDDYVPVPVWRS